LTASAEPGTDRSCEQCLRRCWFLGRLGPYIQNVCDRAPGRRVPELLSLGNADLARAVAPGKAESLLEDLERVDTAAFTTAVAGARCWAICRHDPAFPKGLVQLGDSPHCLLVRGDPEFVLDPLGPDRLVTVVGARRATPYGLAVARSIAGEAAAAGLGVVSGMALGIDGAAHRGALDTGRSLAVLGSGAGRPYPGSHRKLFERLSLEGAVVTEFPPGAPPWRWSFPARNRIMAGLSRLTVVVEATTGSGSLITAEMAADAGREVGAVPGPVTSPQSAGSNELIANGAAVIRDGRDLIEGFAGFDLPSESDRSAKLTPAEVELIEAIGGRALALDSIVENTGMAVGEALEVLASLEMDGYVELGNTGGYSLTPLAGRLVRRMLAGKT
jgi:DNA processing protein